MRTDVRVIVLTYLNTDWYIQQMKRTGYLSAPLPIALNDQAYVQGTNDVLYHNPNAAVDSLDLRQFIQLVGQDSPLLKVQNEGQSLMTYPTTKFFLKVDTAAVQRLGIIPADRRQQLVPEMRWTMGRTMEKKNLVILDMIATNNWQRPIYFSSTVNLSDYMNLEPYFQLEGMAYRLLPLRAPHADKREAEGYVDKTLCYDTLMRKFRYRGLTNTHIFYDENNLRFVANYRDKFARLANAYLAAGDVAKARQVADKCLEVMPDEAVAYDFYTPMLVPALVAGGEQARANELMDRLTARSSQVISYYKTHNESLFDDNERQYLYLLQSVAQAASNPLVHDEVRAQKAYAVLEPYLREQQ